MENELMANIDQVSISTSVFNRVISAGAPCDACIAMAAEAGYRCVEIARALDWGLTEEVAAVKKAGLQVWAVHGILGEGSISSDPAVRKAAVERAYRQAAECADFAPCPLVEHYHDRDFDPATTANFRRSVEELLEKVSPLGFTVCIETAPYKPEVNVRYPDSREIAAFVRSFARDDLQLIVDFNHSNLRENLPDVARITAGLVKSVHISQNMGQRENHLAPDDPAGVIDLKAAFEAFRKCGYTGPCNLEFVLPGPPTAARLAEIREYMEGMLFR